MAAAKGGNEATHIQTRSSQGSKVIEFPSDSAADFWAADLHRFILKLRERQANILERGAAKPLAAHEISIILSELIFRQTGLVVVEDGQELFFDSLCESGPIKDLFLDIGARVELFKLDDGVQLAELLSDLDRIITWYARRALSLHLFEEKCAFRSADGMIGVLRPHLLYDCSRHGLSGFELQTGVYLKGMSGQTAWVVLTVLASGKQIAVSPGYEHWGCAYGNYLESELGSKKAVVPAGALLPLAPNQDRFVVDSFKLFVPYASLPAGIEHPTLELSVLSAEHRALLNASVPTEIITPKRSGVHRFPTVPGPQSIGFWPVDPSTGNGITNLKIEERNFQNSQKQPTEQRSISISFDLSLVGCQGQELACECQIFAADGELVTSEHKSGEGFLPAVAALKLFPNKIVQNYRRLELSLPFSCLGLEPGINSLMVEICLKNSSSRVLCGVLSPFSVLGAPPLADLVSEPPSAERKKSFFREVFCTVFDLPTKRSGKAVARK